MQLYVINQHPAGSNKFKSFLNGSVLSIVLASSALFSTAVFANTEEMTTASTAERAASMTSMSKYDDENKTGLTEVSELDSQLGAYSLEDGAMMGAYGDDGSDAE